MSRYVSVAALLATTMLAGGPAYAQAANPAQAPAGTAAQAPRPSALSVDFVRKAAMTDMLEIQTSQVAATKAQNAEVKRFAQNMIQQHTSNTEKLKAAAKDIAGLTVPTTLDQEHAAKLQQLQAAAAAQFDRMYMDLQVTGHQEAVTLYEQHAQNGDNPQLKQFAQQAVPAIREHLQMAMQVRVALTPPLPVASAGPNQGTPATPNQNQTQNQQQAAAQPGGQIVVQQPSPSIRVDQAPPQVTVQPGQPNVTVRQAQPEIIVRQPAPKIVVDIPQPEIIVRMPRPDVDVAQAQPQVQVTQPPPRVEVIQPQQQAQVDVQRAQPQVSVAPNQSAAAVQVQQFGQPTVRYERAEPEVQITQQQGQPTIRIEQLDQTAANDPNRAATPSGTPAQNQNLAANQAPAGTPNATAPSAAGQPGATVGSRQFQNRQVTVADLDGVDLVNTRNEKLATVDRLVTGPGNQTFAVLNRGGFLGIGEQKIVLPLQNMWMDGNRLVTEMTEDQFRALPEWKADATYRDVSGQTIQIRVPQ